jgi:hypothetical protein
MPTQLEHLRHTLANLDDDGVAHNNPFRQGILAQIAGQERRLWLEASDRWWGDSARLLEMPCSSGPAHTGMKVAATKLKGKTR